MVGAALTGVLALGACTPVLPKPLPQPHVSAPAPKPVCTPGLTLSRFNAIRQGMTDPQVVSVFCGLRGKVTSEYSTPAIPGFEPAHTYIDVDYTQGSGFDFKIVSVSYDNGHEYMKAQAGL
jgi:hypothetical protein